MYSQAPTERPSGQALAQGSYYHTGVVCLPRGGGHGGLKLPYP